MDVKYFLLHFSDSKTVEMPLGYDFFVAFAAMKFNGRENERSDIYTRCSLEKLTFLPPKLCVESILLSRFFQIVFMLTKKTNHMNEVIFK